METTIVQLNEWVVKLPKSLKYSLKQRRQTVLLLRNGHQKKLSATYATQPFTIYSALSTCSMKKSLCTDALQTR